MKIAIIGHSGSGKSTLARKLADKYRIPVLHFDTVQFRPNWEIRPQASKEIMTKVFLDLHPSWVIDGNYKRQCFEQRLAEADHILLLQFNRVACLLRAWKRYRKYKGVSRPSMTVGCNEKFDLEFVR